MLYATGLLIFGQICQKNIGFKFFFYQNLKKKIKKLEMWDMYLTIMSYLWKHLGFTEIFLTFFIFCFLLHFLFFVQMISIKIKQMVSITKKTKKTKQNKTKKTYKIYFCSLSLMEKISAIRPRRRSQC